MDGSVAASTLSVFVQILLLDLLLSGDNAVVIALACRRLPPEQARKAAWIGAAGAIFLRLALTLMTSALMKLPFLQLVSGLLLLVIALNLMAEQHEEAHLAYQEKDGMIAAAGLIVISDAAMSLDNVVALAAVSGGSFWLLAFGLVLTIPLIVYGSFGFSRLMQRVPLLVDVGSALLGWVAGGMIAGDPLFAGFVAAQAPALGLTLPLGCVVFVLIQGRWARAEAPIRSRALPEAPRLALEPLVAPRRLTTLETPPPQASAPPAPKALAPASKPSPANDAPPADEPTSEGDRWMLVGLVALFVIFGVFLTITVFTTQ
jgi:YjbE family integral membrane protein